MALYTSKQLVELCKTALEKDHAYVNPQVISTAIYKKTGSVISSRTIHYMQKGDNSLAPRTAEKFATFLGIHVDLISQANKGAKKPRRRYKQASRSVTETIVAVDAYINNSSFDCRCALNFLKATHKRTSL